MRTINLALACLGLACTAQAADLPLPPPPAPVGFNWTGIYIGAMGGYGFGSASSDNFSGSANLSGGFVGGQFGFNWQAPGSSWVFGVEGDGAWPSIDSSISATAPRLTFAGETKLTALATARARAGWAAGPALFYATGGIAGANNKLSGTLTAPSFPFAAVNDTQTHTGWVVGAGIEYAFARNWTAKAEYNYMSLGNRPYFAANGLQLRLNADVSLVKFGVNYLFH
jgi:outer membrane immunogenic protein